MRIAAIAAALSVMISAGASAKISFVLHQGEPGLVHGNGGESIRSHGITVWTRGTPDAGFRVVGIIKDDRTDKAFDGSALRSAAIANSVRAHGGDAVLVYDVTTRELGVERGGVGGVFNTPSFSDQRDAVIHGVSTRLVVIKTAGST